MRPDKAWQKKAAYLRALGLHPTEAEALARASWELSIRRATLTHTTGGKTDDHTD